METDKRRCPLLIAICVHLFSSACICVLVLTVAAEHRAVQAEHGDERAASLDDDQLAVRGDDKVLRRAETSPLALVLAVETEVLDTPVTAIEHQHSAARIEQRVV